MRKSKKKEQKKEIIEPEVKWVKEMLSNRTAIISAKGDGQHDLIASVHGSFREDTYRHVSIMRSALELTEFVEVVKDQMKQREKRSASDEYLLNLAESLLGSINRPEGQ